MRTLTCYFCHTNKARDQFCIEPGRTRLCLECAPKTELNSAQVYRAYLIANERDAIEKGAIEKQCQQCRKIQPLSRFIKKHGKGLAFACDICREKQNNKPCRAFKNRLISPEEYEKLLLQQDGKCKICASPQGELKYKLAVDHDHQTGKIRGLLCGRCNTALGLFGDSAQKLQAAINYLVSG